jgi:hypothetical protein
MRICALILSFLLLSPALAQGLNDTLTTEEGRVKIFLSSGTLIFVSMFLRFFVMIVSIPLRVFITVLNRIGMEREEARGIILQIFNGYISEYVD